MKWRGCAHFNSKKTWNHQVHHKQDMRTRFGHGAQGKGGKTDTRTMRQCRETHGYTCPIPCALYRIWREGCAILPASVPFLDNFGNPSSTRFDTMVAKAACLRSLCCSPSTNGWIGRTMHRCTTVRWNMFFDTIRKCSRIVHALLEKLLGVSVEQL